MNNDGNRVDLFLIILTAHGPNLEREMVELTILAELGDSVEV